MSCDNINCLQLNDIQVYIEVIGEALRSDLDSIRTPQPPVTEDNSNSAGAYDFSKRKCSNFPFGTSSKVLLFELYGG